MRTAAYFPRASHTAHFWVEVYFYFICSIAVDTIKSRHHGSLLTFFSHYH
ncbi:hypothetical protein [Gallid alphaherpesvirus 2]|nr:hypothetical protein MDV097 [synthetic construct]AFX98006.1 hypothetical protein MDV097 [Gallid alphaherpesvirus 2]ACR02979.1 hypothetical protein MDV097 [synthetic construct]AQN77215.1 hypothetical protein [Gallid alphaherpesvirus 2]AQN77565.1 hypothetical protein [Gallid alphaherpesvirus 2]